jgi:hypothetical protein
MFQQGQYTKETWCCISWLAALHFRRYMLGWSTVKITLQPETSGEMHDRVSCVYTICLGYITSDPAAKRCAETGQSFPNYEWTTHMHTPDMTDVGKILGSHSSIDDEGSKHVWNVGILLPDYTAQQPRRQSSSWQIYFGYERSVIVHKYRSEDYPHSSILQSLNFVKVTCTRFLPYFIYPLDSQ